MISVIDMTSIALNHVQITSNEEELLDQIIVLSLVKRYPLVKVFILK